MQILERFKETAVPPNVELNTITVLAKIRYSGLTFVSVLFLRCNFHKVNDKIFWLFNSFFGWLSSAPVESSVLSFLRHEIELLSLCVG